MRRLSVVAFNTSAYGAVLYFNRLVNRKKPKQITGVHPRPGQVVYNLAVEKWEAARLNFFEIGAKLLKNPADM